VAVGSYFSGSPTSEADDEFQGLIETLSSGTWTAQEAQLPPNYTGEGFDTDNASLSSVTCTAVGSCVAVGSYTDPNGYQQALIETLSDDTWTPSEAQLPSGARTTSSPEAYLDGVTCPAAGPPASCVAVGSYVDTDGDTDGLIETLSSGSWSPSDISDSPLTSVSCTAVGACVAVGAPDLMVETLSSGSWSATQAALPSNGDGDFVDTDLSGVTCTAAGSCVAVGSFYDSDYDTDGLIETLSGGTWSATEAPLPTNGEPLLSLLNGVACSGPGSCVAVGKYHDTSGNTQGLIETLTPSTTPTSFSITVNSSASATIPYGTSATLAESGIPAGATGTVVFSSTGNSDLCTITLPATSCPTSTTLAAATYSPISALFTDTDGNYSGSTSTNTVSLTVSPAATSFSVTLNGSTSATITFGSSATLAESGLPSQVTGTVVFSSTGNPDLCTITLPATSCPTSTTLPAASYSPISAAFTDTDGNYSGSTSTNTVGLTVQTSTGLQGLDVNSNSGTINWAQVAEAGYTFGYARATQGTYFTDPDFQSYWNGMKAVGIRPGATLVVDGASNVTSQVNYFVNAVGADYASGDLVPAVDTSLLAAEVACINGAVISEEGGSCVTAAQAQSALSSLVSDLTSDFGVAPVIYTNATLWGSLGDPTGYGADPLWDVDISSTPPSSSSLPETNWYGDGWALWQYSFTGIVPGITGNVDLDQSNGTALPTIPSIISCPTGANSCQSATSLTSGGSATATDDDTTATASGEGTVTVSAYGALDPETTPNLESNGEYIDVELSSGNSFTSVTIDDCNLNMGDSLQWWNPVSNGGSGGWEAVVGRPGPTYSIGPPSCDTVTLNNNEAGSPNASSPTVSQLTGTVFAVVSVPQPTSLSTSLVGGGQSGTSISVPTSTAVTDSAMLSGANASEATGTVTYHVYSDPACTKAVSTGIPRRIITPGTLPISSPVTLNAPGTYYWQASYSGDANNQASESTCATAANGGEVETVMSATTLKTLLSGSGYFGGGRSWWLGDVITVFAGTSVTDSATLSGTNASSAGGTVTYTVYSLGTSPKFPFLQWSAVASGTVQVSKGSVPDSNPLTLPQGIYEWQASYSGDSLNAPSTSPFGSETETVLPVPQCKYGWNWGMNGGCKSNGGH
jgi:GH25 family lysozyme M1 (1,4-beta-N-acetylmuramidase)